MRSPILVQYTIVLGVVRREFAWIFALVVLHEGLACGSVATVPSSVCDLALSGRVGLLHRTLYCVRIAFPGCAVLWQLSGARFG